MANNIEPVRDPLAEFVREVSTISNLQDLILNQGRIESFADHTLIVKYLNKLHALFLSREEFKAVDEIEKGLLTAIKLTIERFTTLSTEDELLKAAVYGSYYREANKSLTNTTRGLTAKYLPIPWFNTSEIILVLFNVCRIGETDVLASPLYTYNMNEGIWQYDQLQLQRIMTAIQSGYSIRTKADIYAEIKIKSPFRHKTMNPNLVPCKNGIWDMESRKLLPFDPEMVFTTKIDTNLVENAMHPIYPNKFNFDTTLRSLVKSDEDVKLLWQTFQYSAMINRRKNAFFYWYSNQGGSGKGTIATALKTFVGANNTGYANIKAMQSKFDVAEIVDKALCLGDENDNSYVSDNSNMKTLATGEPIRVERKGEQPFGTVGNPLQIQQMNSLPNFKKLDNGTERRLIIIEFVQNFQKNPDNYIKDVCMVDPKLMEYILWKVLNMPVEPLLASENSKIFTKELVMENNVVFSFLSEIMPQIQGNLLPTWLLFPWFLIWCKKNNMQLTWSKRGFTQELLTEIDKFGWFMDSTNKRSSRLSKEDYDLFYSQYLRVNSSQIGVFLPFENMSVEIKQTGRVMERKHI